MKNNLAIVDCETGGVDANANPITEICIEIIEPVNFEILDSYQTYIKPYDDLVITQDALDASRVSMKDVNNGIDRLKVLKKLIELSKKYNAGRYNSLLIFVGHNFGFDIRFLEYLFNSSNKNLWDYFDRFYFDTMRLFSQLEAPMKGSDKFKYNLTNLSERYDIKLTSAHGAAADVAVTKELFVIHQRRLRNGEQHTSEIEQSGKRTTSGKRTRDKITFEF